MKLDQWKRKRKTATFSMQEVIKILICGSVDDGKSTLMGKLMYDAKLILKDQFESLLTESKKYGTQGKKIDLALMSDGLQAEREQGITIDVAYKYLTLKKKKFIFADTPGHVEYTRNLVTGASNSDFSIIIVDASKGILPHTKLCTLISSILRLKRIIVVINKIDLTNYNKNSFLKIKNEFIKYANLLNYGNIDFVPVSALKGDNIVKKSKKMLWYSGKPLLKIIEELSLKNEKKTKDLRLGIQLISRGKSERFYCGEIFSGKLKKNDKIFISSTQEKNIIKEIFSSRGKVSNVDGPQHVSLTLRKNTDISRGSFLSSIENPVTNYSSFNAHIISLNKDFLRVNQKFKIKFSLNTCNGSLDYISYKFKKNNLNKIKSNKLEINEIGLCKISLAQKLPIDKFSKSSKMGSFIIIDPSNNKTIGAGVVETLHEKKDKEIFWQNTANNYLLNDNLNTQKPLVLWFTGISASGKSTIANLVNEKLKKLNKKSYLLDGDNLRHGLCKDLGFSELERKENVRRAAELSKIICNMGYVVLACFISPFKKERHMAKEIIDENNFIEIYCKASIKVCEKRDQKGLYKKARKGEIKNFTGISSPYEAPTNPDLILNSNKNKPNALSNNIINYLKKNNLI